jgi:mannose-6-phosphate isomerase-like protein (cupin superfamily)
VPIKNIVGVGALILMAITQTSSHGTTTEPMKMALACSSSDCPLLDGPPATAGMRGGFVRLKPWESVGWHTTGDHEEALVILSGSGEAQIEGRKPMSIAARTMVYIPPSTRHNVQNTGRELLEYVYVVAPVAPH